MTNESGGAADSFRRAIAAIDAYNARDPNRETEDGRSEPRELVYAHRMTAWLEKLDPQAGEALRLAVRAQHIGRWESARGDYPEGRAGYLAWRTGLAKHHAEITGGILTQAGYEAALVARVQSLLRKEKFKSDAEAQRLEDVACLVFLEFYLKDFAPRHDREKVIGILRKTWRKMSENGRCAALAMAMPDEARALVDLALASDAASPGTPADDD